MNREHLDKMISGQVSWRQNFGQGQEQRGPDGQSWYDLSTLNSLPCEKELAIIVTGWSGHLKYMKATLTAYRKSGALVILAYDMPFLPWGSKNDHEKIRLMPNIEHYLLAHTTVHKHKTWDADKRNGTFWNIRYAENIIRGFPNIKYVYSTNADVICEKYDGYKDVIDLMGDAELMSGQSTDNNIHTANMMFKIDAFNRVYDYIYDIMKTPIIGSRSPEKTLVRACKDLGIKVKHAPKQPLDKDGNVDFYACYDQDSTWKDLLGFKNLFAVYETAGNEGLEMMFLKPYMDFYMDDIYWGGEEKETICQYWKTGDRRYLMKFHEQWNTSDYNRIYYNIEHYGKEPIMDTAIEGKDH